MGRLAETILIIEDDPSTAELMTEVVQAAEHLLRPPPVRVCGQGSPAPPLADARTHQGEARQHGGQRLPV